MTWENAKEQIKSQTAVGEKHLSELFWMLQSLKMAFKCHPLFTLGLLNRIHVESTVAFGEILSPAATPLWNRGHKFIFDTTSIWEKSIDVPVLADFPIRHNLGIVKGSVIEGVIVYNVNMPLKKKYVSEGRGRKLDKLLCFYLQDISLQNWQVKSTNPEKENKEN